MCVSICASYLYPHDLLAEKDTVLGFLVLLSFLPPLALASTGAETSFSFFPLSVLSETLPAKTFKDACVSVWMCVLVRVSVCKLSSHGPTLTGFMSNNIEMIELFEFFV
ncbi:unnamed protein product [Enterobius vermicularis]|uniref:Secreted protein n=1 Tax=Enterobius vermicularis TaxID=51028 RepID=A0A0N4VGC0_ENTVE|nr:unnamed protein product [Enterobius vermicularis]